MNALRLLYKELTASRKGERNHGSFSGRDRGTSTSIRRIESEVLQNLISMQEQPHPHFMACPATFTYYLLTLTMYMLCATISPAVANLRRASLPAVTRILLPRPQIRDL